MSGRIWGDELTRRAELAEAELARRIELDNAGQREELVWMLWADDVARLPRVRSALQAAEVYRAHIEHLLEHARKAKQADPPPPIAKHWAIVVAGAEAPLWQGWQHDAQSARLAWLDSREFSSFIEAVLISVETEGEQLKQILKAVQPFVVVADPTPVITSRGATNAKA